jgi:HSP20 family protein
MFFEFQQPERRATTWIPNVDVCERADAVIIFVEMPGVERSDVHLSWNEGVLTIYGQKRQQTPERGRATYLCLERSYGQFRREITINLPIDHKSAKAELRDGLMRIHLPKSSYKPEPSNIPILLGAERGASG